MDYYALYAAHPPPEETTQLLTEVKFQRSNDLSVWNLFDLQFDVVKLADLDDEFRDERVRLHERLSTRKTPVIHYQRALSSLLSSYLQQVVVCTIGTLK